MDDLVDVLNKKFTEHYRCSYSSEITLRKIISREPDELLPSLQYRSFGRLNPCNLEGTATGFTDVVSNFSLLIIKNDKKLFIVSSDEEIFNHVNIGACFPDNSRLLGYVNINGVKHGYIPDFEIPFNLLIK